jgi:formylglycine-generating enzyme required for sulfatase activity
MVRELTAPEDTPKRRPKIEFPVLGLLTVAISAAIGCVLLASRMTPGTTFRDCDGCPEMVVIPTGSFIMGDSVYGQPQHRVRIDRPFAVAKDMITRDEYEEFVTDGVYAADNTWRDPALHQTGGSPVVNVNWDDAQAYVRWLSAKTLHPYRLLSESEYEYAERAGSKTAFWWGDEAAPVCLYANFHDCSSGPTRVGTYQPNAFGLDDMTGNGFEWVEDCWEPTYDGAPDDGTARTSAGCSVRVMRGTPWFIIDPTPLRSSYRSSSNSGNRSDVIGFRVARNL